jgi:hypothetical protein
VLGLNLIRYEISDIGIANLRIRNAPKFAIKAKSLVALPFGWEGIAAPIPRKV